MKSQYVIFDTEYTSWKGCLENGRCSWQKEEVVQIAAIKVDAETLAVIEEFNIYVKPIINPILSDYFIELTGITNELIVEQGISFEQAYWQFKDFVGGLACFSHGWSLPINSLADGEIMNKNLAFFGLEDCNVPNYKNIAPWFKEMYLENGINIKTQNSGAIAKLLGVHNELENLGLDEHNAIYDVYSILTGIKFFSAKNLNVHFL